MIFLYMYRKCLQLHWNFVQRVKQLLTAPFGIAACISTAKGLDKNGRLCETAELYSMNSEHKKICRCIIV